MPDALGYSRPAGVEPVTRSTAELTAVVVEAKLPRMRSEPLPVNAPFLNTTPS